MARLAGFEPANDGTKTRCLTTWRQPSIVNIISTVAVVVNGGMEGFVAEDGTVEFVLGQAAEKFIDIFGGDMFGFV